MPPLRYRLRDWAPALATSSCNICGWHGEEFATPYHSEGALCPRCGSIARDRYLFWCWTQRAPYSMRHRVLETSPRLDERYRYVMASRVDYVSSDYDESGHKGQVRLDLQDMDLPDASLDVILTPHVLEHVPDTERALSEIYRVLKPAGRMILQIPMPQGVTAPPTESEYHGDNTLVHWRFGWDLREKLAKAGFRVAALVTEDLKTRIESGNIDSGYDGRDCDEVDLLSHADPATLTVVATGRDARRYGFLPDLHFIAWDAEKPS
jgi:SAM-dependent methyltransferase